LSPGQHRGHPAGLKPLSLGGVSMNDLSYLLMPRTYSAEALALVRDSFAQQPDENTCGAAAPRTAPGRPVGAGQPAGVSVGDSQRGGAVLQDSAEGTEMSWFRC